MGKHGSELSALESKLNKANAKKVATLGTTIKTMEQKHGAAVAASNTLQGKAIGLLNTKHTQAMEKVEAQCQSNQVACEKEKHKEAAQVNKLNKKKVEEVDKKTKAALKQMKQMELDMNN